MSRAKADIAKHLGIHRYFYILMLFVSLANIPVFRDLISDWLKDANYSHGFLIIPVSLFLIYRQRKTLVFPAPTARSGLLLMLIGCGGYILAAAAGEYFTTRFSLLLIITGISLYYLGMANFKKIWFAFFFLLFMIPVPAVIYYSATLPMQLMATKITHAFLGIMGVPAIRQGNIIHLPQYSLEVVEACSGLRSLATLMALAALYGHLTLTGTLRPVILFLAAIPIAIVTNIIRLLFTAIGAYAISTDLAEDFLHEFSGLLVFITAMILMFITGAILKWRSKSSS